MFDELRKNVRLAKLRGETRHAGAIMAAVEVANAVRERFGAESLDDLPPSTPKQPEGCLLARAFNFNCRVHHEGLNPVNNQWYVVFPKTARPQAEELARQLGQPLKAASWNLYESGWRVDLPEVIAQVAKAFDDQELPERYYRTGKRVRS